MKRTSALLAITLLSAAPALAAPNGLWDGAVTAFRHLIDSENHRTHIQWSDETLGRRVEFDLHGRVEFTADDRAIASLSPGGELEIELAERGMVRKARIRADRSGQIEMSWSNGGAWLPWDAEAAAWLAELLPGFIRDSGIGAEARVERILAAEGADGVLGELELIRGDWARSRYLLALVDQARLEPAEQVRALAALEKGDSDYEKARVLLQPEWLALEHEGVRAGFLRTASTIDSDYESRRVLAALLAVPGLSSEAIDDVLRLAADIDSDYEKASVLLAIAPSNLRTAQAVTAYLTAASAIDSDYEKRRAMSALLAEKRLGAADTARALAAAAGIDSDYEKATLLVQTASGQSLDSTAQAAFLAAAESLGSAYEKRRALSALLATEALEPRTLAALVRTAASIGSDYEKATLLVGVAEAEGLEGESQREFVRAVATIGSGYERQRALRAFLVSAEVERDTLFGVLALLSTFSSDGEKASLLARIAPRIGGDEELVAAYLEAVESIGSDSDYRRAMRALHRDAAALRSASDRG
jgi:hypothetical protein